MSSITKHLPQLLPYANDGKEFERRLGLVIQEEVEKATLPLRQIVAYQVHNRQVGHTTTLLTGAVNNQDVVIVVANQMQAGHIAQILHKEYGFANPKRNVVTTYQVAAGILKGMRDRPLVVDNFALYDMFDNAGGNPMELEERKGEAIWEK